MFLRKVDYYAQIRADNLEVVSGADAYRVEAEMTAQSEITSYLGHRYDLSKIYIDVLTWDNTTAFLTGSLIELTAPAFSITANYVLNDLVVYTGNVYKAKESVTGAWNPLKWELICIDKTLFSCIKDATGKIPDNVEYWNEGDTRNALIKTYTIDLALYHLHSRINPRNIPPYRIQRRDDVFTWLNRAAKGTVTANLPIFADTNRGQNIRYGSGPDCDANIKNQY